MSGKDWVSACLARRARGGVVTVRDESGGQHEVGAADMPDRFFFGLCPACHKVGEHSACAGCLMVSYCSRPCQKADWPRHKQLCKLIAGLRKSLKTPGHLFHLDPAAQPRVTAKLEAGLGRSLTQYESDVLTHARICLVCHSADQASLQNCPRCHCVAYCSAACREEDSALHGSVCSSLQHCIQDYSLQRTRGDQLQCYLPPLSSPGAPQTLDPEFDRMFLAECAPLFSAEDTPEYRASCVRQLTYTYTCPATVLHALHVSGLAQCTGKTSLVIHVVGARTAEVEQAACWSLLPARLPHLTRVTLVMVGPEIDGGSLPSVFSLECGGGASLGFQLVRGDYRAYSRQTKQYTEPDLVAALNCGFIFYNSWDSSLDPMLRRSGAPLVFTEYYLQDCQLNLEKVRKNTKKAVTEILPPTENPFCSRFAARIPAGFGLRKYGRKNVLMSNDFICIVKAK